MTTTVKRTLARRTRRRFLQRTGATAAGLAMASLRLRASGQEPAEVSDEAVSLGLIGCGRRGLQLLDAALIQPGVIVPVVCDVDRRRSAEAAERIMQAGGNRPMEEIDYRGVLGRSDINAVIIATPDHWHALQLVAACLAGKDVYVETPLSHNPIDGQMMILATRKHRRVVQAGLQHRSGAWFRDAVQRLEADQLGRIAQTRSWAFMRAKPIARDPDGDPPELLDYDRWLGPAPERPYNPARVAHFGEWWDYGGGAFARWNVHLQDLVHAALRVNVPKSVSAIGGNLGLADFREAPDTLEVSTEYETAHGRHYGPFMHVASLRLSNDHAAWGPASPRANGRDADGTPVHHGVQFHGDRATLCVDPDRIALLPADGGDPEILGQRDPSPALPPIDLLTLAHVADFVACVQSRAEPIAPIEAAHYATLACHLANISYRVGRRIYYEPTLGRCFNDPVFAEPNDAANALLVRKHRAPYLPPPV